MLNIAVNFDFTQANLKLGIFNTKQVPFAAALALTRTAQKVQAALVAGMSAAFQAPTSYTLRSMAITRAEKNDWPNARATGFVKGDEAGALRWLRPEIYGGDRSRGIDALLKPLGLPPPGLYAVPGSKAKLSRSGGIDIMWFRSLVADITSQGVTQARGIVTRSTKGTGSRKRKGALQYAVLLERRGNLLPGIYGKRGRGIFPFVVFVRRPHYRAKFDFFGIGKRTVDEVFAAEFDKAIKVAKDSAR